MLPGTPAPNQSLTIMILARGVLFCCIRLAGPLAHMAPPSPPPPLHGDYNDTTVTCVGRGCVSIPIFFILLCCIAGFCRQRRSRRWRAAEEVRAAAWTNAYYGQGGCVPVYAVQQPGCVVQGAPTMVMQCPAMVAAQPAMMPAAQPAMVAELVAAQPVMGSPAPVVNVSPAVPLLQQGYVIQQQPVGEREAEVPMGAPVC